MNVLESVDLSLVESSTISSATLTMTDMYGNIFVVSPSAIFVFNFQTGVRKVVNYSSVLYTIFNLLYYAGNIYVLFYDSNNNESLGIINENGASYIIPATLADYFKTNGATNADNPINNSNLGFISADGGLVRFSCIPNYIYNSTSGVIESGAYMFYMTIDANLNLSVINKIALDGTVNLANNGALYYGAIYLTRHFDIVVSGGGVGYVLNTLLLASINFNNGYPSLSGFALTPEASNDIVGSSFIPFDLLANYNASLPSVVKLYSRFKVSSVSLTQIAYIQFASSGMLKTLSVILSNTQYTDYMGIGLSDQPYFIDSTAGLLYRIANFSRIGTDPRGFYFTSNHICNPNAQRIIAP